MVLGMLHAGRLPRSQEDDESVGGGVLAAGNTIKREVTIAKALPADQGRWKRQAGCAVGEVVTGLRKKAESRSGRASHALRHLNFIL